jgi:hypothetical protein
MRQTRRGFGEDTYDRPHGVAVMECAVAAATNCGDRTLVAVADGFNNRSDKGHHISSLPNSPHMQVYVYTLK